MISEHEFHLSSSDPSSHCQLHDGVDDVVGVVLERLNRLRPTHVGLGRVIQ